MLFEPGTPQYERATAPRNSIAPQHPALVGAPRDAAEVAALVREAARRGLTVVPQATGHGAGAEVGDDALLLDTSALDTVAIDPHRAVATVGSGATWGAVNAAAERHGLLGPAGSAPSVSVSGYTFAGGVGWMVRRDGMASGALRRVRYVDGEGRERVAVDDAAEELDREAIAAFRGAGGVGVATELEIELRPAPGLHAGALLWQADALPGVVAAWLSSLDAVGPAVSTSIAVLHVPPAPAFPEPLRGRVAVHLAVADPTGGNGARVLLDAVRSAARPVADDWGAADAAALGRIHLDPQDAAPALGDARWLTAAAPAIVEELLRTAVAPESPIAMLEVRHVAGAPTRRDGAVTTPPGPFLAHAVGALGRAPRDRIEAALAAARAAWSGADTGLCPGSWKEGAASVEDALPPEVLQRAVAIADRVDPGRRIRRSRLLG